MLEDHSSRWSAAASPGGLIGLVLTILSVMAVVASILSIVGSFELGVSELLLYVVLGVSSFAMGVFLYLLVGYISIRYRLDTDHLFIRWGLWSIHIPYDQIEALAPATEVLEDQQHGWIPFWPGYYIGTLKTDIGDVQVVSTLPARRQILILRSDGEVFAISPERPLLFMEELARWIGEEGQPDARQPMATEPEPLADVKPDIPETPPAQIGEQPAVPEPGQSAAAIPAAEPEASFGYSPDLEPSPLPARPTPDPAAAEYVGPDLYRRPEHDADTSRYQIWSPPEIADAYGVFENPAQLFVDAGWTQEHAAVDGQPSQSGQPRLQAPKPVILPKGMPRSQVLQPLTRVHRGEPAATSPAIRPAIHRDSVSLLFIGIGVLATAAMAMLILVQYQDLPSSLTLHWNVDGQPGRIGEPQEIWILPVIASLVLVANVGLAWSIALFDRFAARLMLSSTLIVHLVTWIALLMILN
ncbi:MAG: PH domain-containing protein [Thermomicrobiaceae bacterium]